MKTQDSSALGAASRVFKALGTAAAELQIYTQDHPRFQETLRWAARLTHDYFTEQADAVQLTFTMRRGHCEFRRIPLVDVGTQGERLTKLLADGKVAGFQLRRGISPDELLLLLDALLRRSKGASVDDSPAAEGADEAAGSGDGKLAKFRLISPKEARRIERTPNGEARPAAPEESSGGLYIPEFLVSRSSIRSILDSYRSLMSTIEQGRELDLDALENATDEAISLLAATDRFLLSSLSMGYFDDFTFHHSVNVCLITTQVASKVVGDEATLQRISLAALLHDVGKSRVPSEILHKPGRLTPAELERMQMHPLHGAEILLGIQDIDPLCIAVAFGHHMNESAASYPRTRVPLECDWLTQLVSVVDVYEALTAVRPYKKGMSPEAAFEVMLSMPGLKKRHSIIKLLYDAIGPYPVGTVVELNTGERAVILDQNVEAPDRPRIRILTDRRGQRLLEHIDVDLSNREEARLQETATSITRTVVCQRPLDNPLEMELEPEPEEILGERPENDEVLMAREG